LIRPTLILHFALTADGKVSTRQNTPSRFTSGRDKHRLLIVRARADAVMVGLGTAVSDRMTMGLADRVLRQTRLERGQREYPLRILVSGSGRVPLDLPLFEKDFSPVLIYSTQRMPPETRKVLEQKASVWLAPGNELDLNQVLFDMHSVHQVHSVVCEGGPTLARGLAELDLIDEIYLTLAPKLFGGAKAPGLLGGPSQFLPASREFTLVKFERDRSTGECYLQYRRANAR
jgi:2,5-diamino-6-(ribosylamino)-4(3H)-pyrimidinone 5'-phosphate reductase